VRETLRAHIDSPGDDSTTFYDAPPEWRFTLRDGRGKIRVTLSRYHRDTGEMYFTCQEHGKPSYDHQSSSALEATLMRLADPEVHNTYKHIVDWLLCPSQSPRVAIAREDAAVEVARSAARLAGHDWDQDRVNERSASLKCAATWPSWDAGFRNAYFREVAANADRCSVERRHLPVEPNNPPFSTGLLVCHKMSQLFVVSVHMALATEHMETLTPTWRPLPLTPLSHLARSNSSPGSHAWCALAQRPPRNAAPAAAWRNSTPYRWP
jgi:hypothetical protein